MHDICHSVSFPGYQNSVHQGQERFAPNNISLITGWTVYTENIEPEVLTYRPTAGKSIRRTEGFIFFVYIDSPISY